MGRRIAQSGLLALAVLVALAVGGCRSDGTVSLKEADLADGVTLSVGQEMEISLGSNPTTGYSWQVADDAGGVVSMVGTPAFEPDPAPAGVVGKGGSETLTFKAVKAGEGTLRLEYRRPWEKNAAARTIEVRVEVK